MSRNALCFRLILVYIASHRLAEAYVKEQSSGRAQFNVINEWKYLDFEYPTYMRRKDAIANREFIPDNNLPLGIDFYRNRLFITTPRWKDGVPASLNVIPYPPTERSPTLRPYPNWELHGNPYAPDCSKLMSVYRTSIDKCGRIWAIDSGIINATVSLTQICMPKIVAFDLETDEILINYELPADQVKQDSLHSNILVDVQLDQCDDAYVYVTDVWRYGLLVYSLKKNRSWRITNYNFSPNPIAADFNVHGQNFQWLDGIFGMSLSIEQPLADSYKHLYFHPMASFKEFVVSTALLRDENNWLGDTRALNKYFLNIGDRGGNGQSSSSGIDRDGVMFFTQVHRDDIGCWDTKKSYTRANIAMLTRNSSLIRFPNDLKVDQEIRQSVWVMSNNLPTFLYDKLDYNNINFRILQADVKSIVAGTQCDPKYTTNSGLSTVTVLEGQCY